MSNAHQRLWRVTLRGQIRGVTSAYVVALNSDAAYRMVRKWLDDHDYGFEKDRELERVELLAEDYDYTDVGCRLFLPGP